jgi:hypothetical protein
LREKAVTYIIAEVIVLEFTGLEIRRRLDEKTGLVLPVHGTAGRTGKQSPVPAAEIPPEESAPAKKEDVDEPGGLAEIIRDLTRRPRT